MKLIIGNNEVPSFYSFSYQQSLATFVDTVTIELLDNQYNFEIEEGQTIQYMFNGELIKMVVYSIQYSVDVRKPLTVQITGYNQSIEPLLNFIKPKKWINTTDNAIISELLAGYKLELDPAVQIKEKSISSEMSKAQAVKDISNENGFMIYENRGTIYKKKPIGLNKTNVTIHEYDILSGSSRSDILSNVYNRIEGYGLNGKYEQMFYQSPNQDILGFFSGKKIDIDRALILNLSSKDDEELKVKLEDMKYKTKSNGSVTVSLRGIVDIGLQDIVKIELPKLKVNKEMYAYDIAYYDSGDKTTTISFSEVGQKFP